MVLARELWVVVVLAIHKQMLRDGCWMWLWLWLWNEAAAVACDDGRTRIKSFYLTFQTAREYGRPHRGSYASF